MASVLAPTAGFLERILPLSHWLGTEAGKSTELGQARTRLICTLVGLSGFVIAGQFAPVPNGIVVTAILFPLYAVGLALHVYWRAAPTHARRGIALLVDNLVNSYVASFGGPFAAYAGFHFLVTVGWGLRFGRHYLWLASAIAIGGMLCNLFASSYWQANLLFGGTIIFGIIAASTNTTMLLGRIARGNRSLAVKIDEVAQLAGRDPLTRLPNRLHFRERLTQALAAASRNGSSLALLLFDLDGFKSVNDTLGHEAGDRLLQEISNRISRHVRQSDTFARWGGDEFVILMEAIRDRSDATRVAEMVMKVIGEIDIFADVRVGASIGICTHALRADERPNPDELLRRCDRAMYEAKRAGKGCYRFTPA